ncbi:hypothetical protein I317_00564 [Kwoniella heveanensis CBS 569]|nr:hypothetical protein I317_00564 [Kwoniella heveanensis CBS 569]
MPSRPNKRACTSQSTQAARNRRRSADNDTNKAQPFVTNQPLSSPPRGALLFPSTTAAALPGPASLVGPGPSSSATHLQPQPQLLQPQPQRAQPFHGEVHPTLERREYPGEQRQQSQPQQARDQSQSFGARRAQSTGQRRPFGRKPAPDPNLALFPIDQHGRGGINASTRGLSFINEASLKDPYSASKGQVDVVSHGPRSCPHKDYTEPMDNEDSSHRLVMNAIERLPRRTYDGAQARPIPGRRSPFPPPSSISRNSIPRPLDYQFRHDAQLAHRHYYGQPDLMMPSSSTSTTFSASAVRTPTTADTMDVAWPRGYPSRSTDWATFGSAMDPEQEPLPFSAAPPAAPSTTYVSRFDNAPEYDLFGCESPGSEVFSRPSSASTDDEVPRRKPVGLGLDMNHCAVPVASGSQETQRSESHQSQSQSQTHSQSQRSRVSIYNLINAEPVPVPAEPEAEDVEPRREPRVERVTRVFRGLGLFGVNQQADTTAERSQL